MSTFISFIKAWNDVQNLTTPKHHCTMATWLQKQWKGSVRKGLLLAFRNSGKSTIVGLFCAWILKENPNLRILIVAADHALAKKMVRNVKRIIERHPETQDLLPEKKDQWASGQFTVQREVECRDPSMIAQGIGGNVTGSRADIIICDDVEIPKNCDSRMKREDLREKLKELDYVLIPGGMQLYIGTPHTYHTIYKV